jgi:hypothetical protein
MTLKFNPFTKKLDYFLHQGIASYKFTGWKELADMTNPGDGNFYFNYYDGMYAVMSLTNSHGHYMGENLMMIYFALEYYDCILYYHGKTNSDQYIGSIIIPDEDWIEITEGEGDDEIVVAYAVPIWPVFFPMMYDAEEDEYVIDEFPENDEVLMSIDLAFNQDYLGGMAGQDPDSVYIYGGDISSVNLYGGEDKKWTLPRKTTTGDPSSPIENQIYVNTFDKLVRIYLDSTWRTLLDYS